MTCRCCIDVLGTEAEETRTKVESRLRATTTALCAVFVILCPCDVCDFFRLHQRYTHGRYRLYLS